MKKSLIVMLCVIMIIAIIGCGEVNTEDMDVAANTQNNTAEKEEKNNISGDIPEWLLPFSELKQYSESIYLNEEGRNFELKNNKLVIPESNILIITKELAGRNTDAVTQNKDDILDIIRLLKCTDVLEEADTINPNSHWLGLNFDIVFLTVDGKYALLDFDIFDDDRICVNVIAQEDDSDFSFWLKSAELSEKIKSVSEYEEYDLQTCDDIVNIEIRDSKNGVYTLSKDELVKMKEMLKNIQEKTDSCKGPFDIQFIATRKDGDIYMKWCNDDCQIMAIEGMYYKIDSGDADWIQQICSHMHVDNRN